MFLSYLHSKSFIEEKIMYEHLFLFRTTTNSFAHFLVTMPLFSCGELPCSPFSDRVALVKSLSQESKGGACDIGHYISLAIKIKPERGNETTTAKEL